MLKDLYDNFSIYLRMLDLLKMSKIPIFDILMGPRWVPISKSPLTILL